MISKIWEKFPIGFVEISALGDNICEISLTNSPKEGENFHPVLSLALKQLHEYFEGQRRELDFPTVYPFGTAFQKKVWDEMAKIPYGETASYGEIARRIGCPKGARAVGGAAHVNPLLIVRPCHRVISASGAVGGFAHDINIKLQLLELEKKYKENQP